MPWTALPLAAVFVTGSWAIPAPSIFLVPPHPSSRDDPIHISCTAPKDFLGANFTLYRGGEVLQLLQAPKDQPGVTFTVTARDGGEAAGGNFSCQYGVVGEHGQPQLSDLSQPLQVSLPVSTWILVLSLSLAGAALLLMGLVVIALTVRKVKVKNLQKQREQESYWAQINFTNTDMSFENSWFDISKKITQEEDPKATLDTPSCNSGKPTSQLSPEPPNLSTFRPCQ